MKTGIYVDAANAEYNGGFYMRYEILKDLAMLQSGMLLRANAYIAIDHQRMEEDSAYREGRARFMRTVRRNGFKIIEKPVQRFVDPEGNVTMKANADLDMAVDALVQSVNLDRVILVTGDGDFVRVVTALQNRGCRVVVVGFRNVSRRLREEADSYHSGFLIPDLVQAEENGGSKRLRGYVSHYKRDRQFGYLCYLTVDGGRLREDSVWFHRRCVDENARNALTSGDLDRRPIFEFEIAPSEVHEGKLEAADVRLYESSVLV